MQRVYRSARRCPHCGSNWMPKAGFSHGKQTYRCGECRHHPSPEGNRHYHPPLSKRTSLGEERVASRNLEQWAAAPALRTRTAPGPAWL